MATKTEVLRELPVASGCAFESVGAIKGALRDFEDGNLSTVAQLCDAFGTDDRIRGVLDTRVDALFGLPLEVSSDAEAESSASGELAKQFDTWFPSAELKRFLRWGVLLRTAFGRIEFERGPRSWTPRFRCWKPHYCRWDEPSRTWRTQIDGGGEVEITPGRNGWVVYAPDGLDGGWMQGLVRSLALMFVIRKWAWRDWVRYSEVHGLPIRLGIVPMAASEQEKQEFFRAIRGIGGEAAFRIAKDESGNGFDLKLLEASSQSWQGFLRLIEKSDECIAVDVLGQNLTTSAKAGGSYALGDVHDRIRLDRLEGDAKSLASCLRMQAVTQWYEAAYGSAELAPAIGWSTKAPEDRAAAADTLNKLGDATKKLLDAGFPVDLEALAKQYRIPLLKNATKKGSGQIFQYHLTYGVVTTNEVRDRLGLPAREGGDVPPTPTAAPAATPAETTDAQT